LETVGEPRALGAGASLTAYRATQEALRVAREDGGAREAVVTVAHEPTAVRVAVDDDGRGDRGPLAVRERVLLYGGELTVARVPDEAPERRGWHRTAVRLPRGAAA
jgi:signal transduction histidine kinase